MIQLDSKEFELLPLKERVFIVKELDQYTFLNNLTKPQRKVCCKLWLYEMANEGMIEFRDRPEGRTIIRGIEFDKMKLY